MKYQVHKEIEKKLKGFIKNNKIPNILFHGENGSGKKTILNDFLDEIYKNTENKKNYIMYVNCAHGKGIKFIRDELKFFARTNLNYKTNVKFKSIILLNAEKLTVDAQSALRRCIELFSNTTRFFIVIENKSRLLKPIISRFCDIYVPRPYKKRIINLHSLKQSHIYKPHHSRIKYIEEQIDWVFMILTTHYQIQYQYGFKVNASFNCYTKSQDLYDLVENLYELGINGFDILKFIEYYPETEIYKKIEEDPDDDKWLILEKDNLLKYKLLVYFDKIRHNYRNEKLFMIHILYVYLMRHEIDLENICNM